MIVMLCLYSLTLVAYDSNDQVVRYSTERGLGRRQDMQRSYYWLYLRYVLFST